MSLFSISSTSQAPVLLSFINPLNIIRQLFQHAQSLGTYQQVEHSSLHTY